MKHKVPCHDLDGLVNGVIQCYNEFDWRKMRNVWITLQCVMNEIIEMDGGFVRKIPHINKEKMEREGMLMTVMQASKKARLMVEGSQVV